MQSIYVIVLQQLCCTRCILGDIFQLLFQIYEVLAVP